MLEITGDDIAALKDEDLRTLVGRLSEEEVRRRNLTLSVSNSLSGGDRELDEIPAMGDPAHMMQVGGARHGSTREGQRRLALQ